MATNEVTQMVEHLTEVLRPSIAGLLGVKPEEVVQVTPVTYSIKVVQTENGCTTTNYSQISLS